MDLFSTHPIYKFVENFLKNEKNLLILSLMHRISSVQSIGKVSGFSFSPRFAFERITRLGGTSRWREIKKRMETI